MFGMSSMGAFSFTSLQCPEPLKLDQNALSNIKFFRKQWKRYCIASGLDKVSEEVKNNMLRTVIGMEAINFIEAILNYPAEKFDSEKILQALESHFIPKKKNVVYERFCFNSIVQHEQESVAAYLSRINQQVVHCEFSENVINLVHDRFVAGLRNKSLIKQIFENDRIFLSLPDLVTFCIEWERENVPHIIQTSMTPLATEVSAAMPPTHIKATVNGNVTYPADIQMKTTVNGNITYPADIKMTTTVNGNVTVTYPVDMKVNATVNGNVTYPTDVQMNAPVNGNVTHPADLKVHDTHDCPTPLLQTPVCPTTITIKEEKFESKFDITQLDINNS